jgi:hypothetical protein
MLCLGAILAVAAFGGFFLLWQNGGHAVAAVQ